MTINRQILIDLLSAYHSTYAEEFSFRDQFLSLLEHPRCFHRDHLPGHLTGSAWIIDKNHQSVLLTHHAKLNKWLQPGGHADGDEDIFAVALRETEEETGLKKIHSLRPEIFDIDIHVIPSRKDFPEHFHYDVRFLFEASQEEPLLISEESNDLKWHPIKELEVLTDNLSMIRMRDKVLSGFIEHIQK